MGYAVPKMCALVNRTTSPIDGTFDGQPLVIPPGYLNVEGKITGAGPNGTPFGFQLPEYAAEMVKRQNPIMGTEDPENMRDVEYLLGVEAWGDDISHVEQSDSEERFDRELMGDEARGARKVSTGNARRKKKKGRGRLIDERLRNPAGIKADYND